MVRDREGSLSVGGFARGLRTAGHAVVFAMFMRDRDQGVEITVISGEEVGLMKADAEWVFLYNGARFLLKVAVGKR